MKNESNKRTEEKIGKTTEDDQYYFGGLKVVKIEIHESVFTAASSSGPYEVSGPFDCGGSPICQIGPFDFVLPPIGPIGPFSP